jgi:hypothetical protein
MPAIANAQLPKSTGGYATLSGVAIDSVRGGFLTGASVRVSGTQLVGITDSQGRFRIDSVPPGFHSVRLGQPLLDTLGLSVVTKPAEFTLSRVTTLILAIPSPSTIVQRKCSQSERELGEAALIGSVVDADTEEPSVGATVAVRWMDFKIAAKSLTKESKSRTAQVRSDGSYLICGLASDLVTGVIAFRGTDSTASVTVNFESVIAIQSFSLPRDFNIAPSSSSRPYASGALLTGSVIGPDRKPLAGARVAIDEDNVATVSDAAGHFALRGARSGTRAVTVRKIGFQPAEIAIDLSARRPKEVVLELQNAVRVLEAVRVTALRDIGLQKVGFTERQRIVAGRFFTPQEIESRNPLRLNYLLESASMLRAKRTNDGRRIITGRRGGCVRYFVDGHRITEANPTDFEALPDSYLSGAELGAVEVYDPLSAPAEYIALSRTGDTCSIVVIWTKWKLGLGNQ